MRFRSSVRAEALDLVVEAAIVAKSGDNWTQQVLSISVAEPEDAEPMVLRAGDRLQLSLTSSTGNYVYLYEIDPKGQAYRVPDRAARPVRLEPGQPLKLPDKGAITVRGPAGRWSTLILAGPERIRAIEDLDLLYRQSGENQRQQLGMELIAALKSEMIAEVSYLVD